MAEEQQEAIAAMEDVEDRQRKAVERAKKNADKDDESDDDEKDSKKNTSHGSDDEVQEQPKQEMPKSIVQVSKEMAIRNKI